jgi:hypothetical protein
MARNSPEGLNSTAVTWSSYESEPAGQSSPKDSTNSQSIVAAGAAAELSKSSGAACVTLRR